MMRQIEFATFQPEKSFPIGRIYGPVSPEKTLIVRNPLFKSFVPVLLLLKIISVYKWVREQQTYYVGEEECFIIVPRDANGQERLANTYLISVNTLLCAFQVHVR